MDYYDNKDYGMSGSKMSIKRILAVSGAGVALATALVLAGIAHKNIKTDNLHYVAGLTPTTFVSDTINVDCSAAIEDILFGVIYAGTYDRMNNMLYTYHYRDLTGTEVGHTVVDMINQSQKQVLYHELRHAYNSRLMWRYDKLMGPDVFVIDEVSARVAENLAKISDKPSLKPGVLYSNVSYNISQDYDLKKIADFCIKNAVKEIEQTFEVSADIFKESSFYSQYDPVIPDVKINKKTLVNEMMVFEINGKKQNLMQLASKDVQESVEILKNKVENYLNAKYR